MSENTRGHSYQRTLILGRAMLPEGVIPSMRFGDLLKKNPSMKLVDKKLPDIHHFINGLINAGGCRFHP